MITVPLVLRRFFDSIEDTPDVNDLRGRLLENALLASVRRAQSIDIVALGESLPIDRPSETIRKPLSVRVWTACPELSFRNREYGAFLAIGCRSRPSSGDRLRFRTGRPRWRGRWHRWPWKCPKMSLNRREGDGTLASDEWGMCFVVLATNALHSRTTVCRDFPKFVVSGDQSIKRTDSFETRTIF